MASDGFPGKIGTTYKESTPHWPDAPRPPKGAPNILIVLFDDVGFSDFGCYGSAIETPAIDAIAANTRDIGTCSVNRHVASDI